MRLKTRTCEIITQKRYNETSNIIAIK